MFFNKKKKNLMLELRNKILNGDLEFNKTAEDNYVNAVIMDVGTKLGAYSLIVTSDGSCSLYFQKGGGIIGAGEHKNVQYVCKILLNKARDLLENPVLYEDCPLPKDNHYNIHIVTRNGVCKFTGKEDTLLDQNNSTILFTLCNNIITQLRLIDEKKNVPFTNDEILINFIKENNYEAFILALEELKNPDAVSEEKSALMISAYIGNKEIMKKLIQEGASLTYCDSTGLNPLMIACYLGKADLIEILANEETLESKDEAGFTPLMFACNAGKLDCVKLLIDMNADVNAKDNEESTPLMFASQNGYNSIVSYLLEKGADKNHVGKHGLEAIDFASKNNHISTVDLLM